MDGRWNLLGYAAGFSFRNCIVDQPFVPAVGSVFRSSADPRMVQMRRRIWAALGRISSFAWSCRFYSCIPRLNMHGPILCQRWASCCWTSFAIMGRTLGCDCPHGEPWGLEAFGGSTVFFRASSWLSFLIEVVYDLGMGKLDVLVEHSMNFRDEGAKSAKKVMTRGGTRS